MSGEWTQSEFGQKSSGANAGQVGFGLDHGAVPSLHLYMVSAGSVTTNSYAVHSAS